MNTSDLAKRLADTAAGTWGEEAAVWLLTQHGRWLPQLAEQGIITTAPEAPDWAAIEWGEIAKPVADGMYHRLYGTPSEWQVMRIAVALADSAAAAQLPGFMNDLSSLDEQNRRLVLHAIAWAAGGRDWAEQLCLTSPSNCLCPDGADWHQYGCPQFGG